MERRTVPGLMPCSSNSRALNWEWVVVAGWITRDFTSATLASNENICKLSIKRLRFLHTAPHLKRKDRTASIRKVFPVKRVVRMLGQGRVVHGNHFGMLLQEFNHFQGILHMTFHAKRQRLQSLQQNESLKGLIVAPVSRNNTARIRMA